VSRDREDRRLKIKNPVSTARHTNDPRVKTGWSEALVCVGLAYRDACVVFRCLWWRGETFSIGRFCGSDLSQPINSEEICAKMEDTQGVIGLETL
jgi:hypothetical protein